jgi:hypothetical protein
MVDLEPPDSRGAIAERAPVVPRAHQHHLVDAVTDGADDRFVEEAGSLPEVGAARPEQRERHSYPAGACQPVVDLGLTGTRATRRRTVATPRAVIDALATVSPCPLARSSLHSQYRGRQGHRTTDQLFRTSGGVDNPVGGENSSGHAEQASRAT